MNPCKDDERLDDSVDRPTPPPEPVPGRGNNRRPPPSDVLVYGTAIQPCVPPALPEPLLNPEPAD